MKMASFIIKKYHRIIYVFDVKLLKRNLNIDLGFFFLLKKLLNSLYSNQFQNAWF